MSLSPTNKVFLTGGLQDTGVKAGLQKFVPEIWGESIKDYMEKKLVVGNLAKDLSALVAGGGDLIHIPQHDELVAEELYTGKDSGVLTTPISFANTTTAGSEYQLIINQSAVSAVAISDLIQAQSSYELMNLYTEKLGYALALKVEKYLMQKLIENVSYNYTGSTDGASIGNYITFTDAGSYNITTKVAVPNMLTALLEADGSVEDYVMLLTPQTYSSLWKLDEFVKFDGVGNSFGNEVPNVSGYVGKLAGVDAVVSNNFVDIGDSTYPIDSTPTFNASEDDTSETTHLAGLIMHRESLHIAYASGMKARVQSDYNLDSLSTRFVADSVYGCTIIGNNTTNKKVFALIDAS